jgi:hypothetical protein
MALDTARDLFVPATFAGASLVFVLLYEALIRDVVTGPVLAGASPERDQLSRQRSVRAVFAGQVVLSAVCLAVAHALFGIDWDAQAFAGTSLSLAGGIVGVVGCAFALAAPLARRTYSASGRT